MSTAAALLTAALYAVVLAATATRSPFRSKRSPGETVENYDIVHPHIIDAESFRPHPKLLVLEICRREANFTLKLEMNEQLLPDCFSSQHFDPEGSEVVTKGKVTNCCYQGEVLGQPEWSAVACTCHGLRASFGVYGNRSQFYHMEPLEHDRLSLEDAHVIYVDSELSTSDGTCGSGHAASYTSELNSFMEAYSARARRQEQTYFVELVMVSDYQQFLRFGSSLTQTTARAIELVNSADRLYQPLNVRIVLAQVITWNMGDRISTSSNPDVLLDRFQLYYNSISSPHDASLLLTGNNLNGNTIGIAFLTAMCYQEAVGIVQDGGRSVTSVAATVAHELGHLLNMYHDDSSSCGCPDGRARCIMASASFAPRRWSQCSQNQLLRGFRRYSLNRCLSNVPPAIGQYCGDGVVEGEEECDCGSASECTDVCCNANTCKLVPGAHCSPSGEAKCCTATCQLRPYGSLCRAASGQCDIAEYCSGTSTLCPTDLYTRDGIPCSGGQAYCFSGQCRTQAQQCMDHFGTSAVPGLVECFSSYNTRGDAYGNCGYTATRFKRCQPSDTRCGMLFCTGGLYQANVASRVNLVTVRVYSRASRRYGECQAFTTYPGTDFKNPGLVQDGTKCGIGKMCFEQQCQAVAEVGSPACPVGGSSQQCSGNGQCSSTGVCVCNVGFIGEACGLRQNSTPGCMMNNGGCDHVCRSVATGFQCSCRTGYQLDNDGRNCNDINECNINNGGCVHICTNTLGSFRCSCRDGYQLTSNQQTCYDNNECNINNGGCDHVCTNTPGSFQCSCRDGYRLASNGQTCTDINECYVNNGGCGHICTNILGSFLCSCRDGYQLTSNGRTCNINDNNECNINNGGCDHVCTNTPGSFQCSCRDGYRLASNRQTCTEINECSVNNGGCEHICTNTLGSFRCSCRNGYQLASNGQTCNAIDECNINNGDCDHICTNTLGSFQCSCRNGYQLTSNGQTCDEINECNINSGGCDHVCTNTLGSFQCSCRDGYLLTSNGRTCNDINECYVNNGGCGHICTNTLGSFRCSCRDGYQLTSNGQTCTAAPPTAAPPTAAPPTAAPSAIPFNPSCGLYTTAAGFIESDGWPERYSTNDDCEWIISLPDQSRRVRIKFLSPFGLAGSRPCTRDYVELSQINGTGPVASSLRRLCNCCSPPDPLTVQGSVVRVVFHSGPAHGPRRRGFHFQYESV